MSVGVPAALGGAKFNEPEGLHGFGHDLIASQQSIGDFHPAVGFRADFDRRAEIGIAINDVNEHAFGCAQEGRLRNRGYSVVARQVDAGWNKLAGLERRRRVRNADDDLGFAQRQRDDAPSTEIPSRPNPRAQSRRSMNCRKTLHAR